MDGRPMKNIAPLAEMALFVEIARQGSFTKASTALNIPMATLSRRVSLLEKEFGVLLLNRSTRKVELTEVGKRYFERCAHLVDEAVLAQESLRDAAKLPSGHINISMPVDLGIHLIGPFLPEFRRIYPDISFNLDLSAQNSDLISSKMDVAIRIGVVKEEQLIARKIGAIQMQLYASPSYLDLKGRPLQPGDLSRHECLLTKHVDKGSVWCLASSSTMKNITISGSVAANNLGLVKQLAEKGQGIAMLPPFLAKESLQLGHLEQVLPGWVSKEMPISAVMTSRLLPAAVTTFLDYIQPKLTVALYI